MGLINYKSSQFRVLSSTAPFADGGAAINDNFKKLCSTSIFNATTDPTTSDNDAAGKDFAVGSLWHNTSSQAVKILAAIDPTTHNATWVNVDAGTGSVPSTRTIGTTAPLAGGGDLSADRALSITVADATNAGTMSAAHFSLVDNATDANAASTLVKRDSNGDFSARNVSGSLFQVNSTGLGILQGVNIFQLRVNAHLATDGLCGIGHPADPSAQLYVGGAGTIYAGGDITSSGNVDASTYRVSGTQVVAAQQAAIADATNSTDVITQLNALLAAMRTHGLIAT